MNPIRTSLRYPQVTLVLTAMLVVAGMLALFTSLGVKIQRSRFVPVWHRNLSGATSQEVDAQVTHKIEERLFRFAEVRRAKTFRPRATAL